MENRALSAIISKPCTIHIIYIMMEQVNPRKMSVVSIHLHMVPDKCLHHNVLAHCVHKYLLFVLSSSINDITRILPLHFGHRRGSTLYIFCINLAQFLRNLFLPISDSEMLTPGFSGSVTALLFFFRCPRDLLE